MRENWVVICGAARNRERLEETVLHHHRLRKAGTINGVVLSTWYGEIDQHQGLRDLLETLGIGTVETADPGMDRSGNLARQTKQLRLGLELCPEDAFVLKTRTDKNLTTDLDTAIFSTDLTPDAESYPGFPPLFEHRIAVNEAHILSPFFITDFEFYGHRRDLTRLLDLNANLWFRHNGWREHWIPEIRLFGLPFCADFPVFRAYFRRAVDPVRINLPDVPVYRHESLSPEASAVSAKIVRLVTSDKFASSMLMTWWAILDRYFRIGLTQSAGSETACAADRERLAGVPLEELLAPATSPGHGLPNNTRGPDNYFIRARNHAFLDAFRQGELADTADYRRLRAVYETVSDNAFHAEFRDSLGEPHPGAARFFQKLTGIIGEQPYYAIIRKPGQQYEGI
ncbi:hypothetical protein GM415_05380 [Pseudodesulfovibrio cashew]|uniref:Uncharacterized protein n=1 Tax=Pseudodesulfovibrio cashew TaxID=2678688 RepID=A0A6I6JGS6_9BACT|nr:hypothetical protein [Pseudodesulfovibrio cashew]QGY39572.1 hypothetical protein GM415_05380 [Pseudodesulfovibrio cashew]